MIFETQNVFEKLIQNQICETHREQMMTLLMMQS